MIIYGHARMTIESPFGVAARPYTSDRRSRVDSTRIKGLREARSTLRELFPTLDKVRSRTLGRTAGDAPGHSPFVRVDFDTGFGVGRATPVTGGFVLSHVAATALPI